MQCSIIVTQGRRRLNILGRSNLGIRIWRLKAAKDYQRWFLFFTTTYGIIYMYILYAEVGGKRGGLKRFHSLSGFFLSFFPPLSPFCMVYCFILNPIRIQIGDFQFSGKESTQTFERKGDVESSPFSDLGLHSAPVRSFFRSRETRDLNVRERLTSIGARSGLLSPESRALTSK